MIYQNDNEKFLDDFKKISVFGEYDPLRVSTKLKITYHCCIHGDFCTGKSKNKIVPYPFKTYGVFSIWENMGKIKNLPTWDEYRERIKNEDLRCCSKISSFANKYWQLLDKYANENAKNNIDNGSNNNNTNNNNNNNTTTTNNNFNINIFNPQASGNNQRGGRGGDKKRKFEQLSEEGILGMIQVYESFLGVKELSSVDIQDYNELLEHEERMQRIKQEAKDNQFALELQREIDQQGQQRQQRQQREEIESFLPAPPLPPIPPESPSNQILEEEEIDGLDNIPLLEFYDVQQQDERSESKEDGGMRIISIILPSLPQPPQPPSSLPSPKMILKKPPSLPLPKMILKKPPSSLPLPKLILKKPQNIRVCSICLEDMNDDIFYTECIHGFHEACLTVWINSITETSCPICRTKINSRIENGEKKLI